MRIFHIVQEIIEDEPQKPMVFITWQEANQWFDQLVKENTVNYETFDPVELNGCKRAAGDAAYSIHMWETEII